MSTIDKATKNNIISFLKIFTIFLCIILLISSGIHIYLKTNNIFWISVYGESMEPTLKDNSIVFIKNSESLENDDLVIFNNPEKWQITKDTNLIKRIAAKPNDTIEFRNKVMYVNNEKVYDLNNDNYYCKNYKDEKIELASNQIFVLGDNHNNSVDSLRVYCNFNKIDSPIDTKTVLASGKPVYQSNSFILNPLKRGQHD